MPAFPRSLDTSRVQTTGRFWLGADSWWLWLVGALFLGIAAEASAGIAISIVEEPEEHGLAPLKPWEQPGILAALQDRSKKTRLAALACLIERPTQDEAIIQRIQELRKENDGEIKLAARHALEQANTLAEAPNASHSPPTPSLTPVASPISATQTPQRVKASLPSPPIIGRPVQTNPADGGLTVRDLLKSLESEVVSEKNEAAAQLGAMGDVAKPYASKIAAHLADEEIDVDVFRLALSRLGPSEEREKNIETWMSMLAAADEQRGSRHNLRVDVYLLSGHDPQLLTATAWLGRRQEDELPDIGKLSHDAKKQAIEALDIALHFPERKEFHEVAKEAAEHIARLVSSGGWRMCLGWKP